MDHPKPQSTEGDGIIRLQIDDKLSGNWSSGSNTIFEPQRQGVDLLEKGNSSSIDPGSSSRPTLQAPEKKLTLFALQVAVLQKIATGLGALGFIWATVVLLGGYAIRLSPTDFWFITIILLIEGARIFSRSRELEWQHQSTWSIAEAGMYSFRALKLSSSFIVRAMKGISGSFSEHQRQEHKEKTNEARPSKQLTRTSRELKEKTDEASPSDRLTRTWTSSEVPLLPYAGWFFLSRNISRLFYWLQWLSASACITLSIVRLVQLRYRNAIDPNCTDCQNERSALIVFYGLASAEAFLSLFEKAYWEWTLMYRKLLEEVNKECEFGSSDMISIQRFFYDAYKECVDGSIFDGLKLDLVSFATELLASDSSDEQLIGARILQKFSTNPRFSYDTLQKIGTSTSVIERLVEMLNWKNPRETEIRQAAAEILSKLAGKKQNSLRVAGIPGAMESISSLLYIQHNSDGASDETWEREIVSHRENEFSTCNQLGLTILKKLARNHDNCEKIGNTRGLLPKIIDFTYTGERLLRNSHDKDSRILAAKRSLQVLKLLARTSGTAGKHLREEIVEIVFTVTNIREILKYGEKHPMLQILGIEILINLTFEVEATERIGSTGGIIKELFRIFFQEQNPEDRNNVSVAAGEAIAKLALKSEKNCCRILNQNVLTKLVRALEDPALRINSARILRNVCTYADQDCIDRLKGVSTGAPTVLKTIMSADIENKLQEVMLGLAAQVYRFMNCQEARIVFNQTGIDEAKLAKKLVEILEFYQYPSSKVPRMRRFAIELAISMMEKNRATIRTFSALGMEKALETLRETTSEIESFDIFDGTAGLSRHNIAIHTLVDNALELLANG